MNVKKDYLPQQALWRSPVHGREPLGLPASSPVNTSTRAAKFLWPTITTNPNDILGYYNFQEHAKCLGTQPGHPHPRNST
eukprot:1141700-Pelagomonas_calceolata.AAC.7